MKTKHENELWRAMREAWRDMYGADSELGTTDRFVRYAIEWLSKFRKVSIWFNEEGDCHIQGEPALVSDGYFSGDESLPWALVGAIAAEKSIQEQAVSMTRWPLTTAALLGVACGWALMTHVDDLAVFGRRHLVDINASPLLGGAYGHVDQSSTIPTSPVGVRLLVAGNPFDSEPTYRFAARQAWQEWHMAGITAHPDGKAWHRARAWYFAQVAVQDWWERLWGGPGLVEV